MWPFKEDERIEGPVDRPKALHMSTHADND